MNNQQKKIRQEIIEWQNRFPLDFWWRKKHNIAYMSKVHRETNFLDQLFEYEEERMVEEIKESFHNPYTPNEGDFWKNTSENDYSPEEQIKNAESEFEEYLKGIK